ncbi:MAG: transglutaminase-like domain-containing protein [Eubacteriales bacterium]|nr:transglutaminase-like domain-containing protein [Eubacteriales bacterium]
MAANKKKTIKPVVLCEGVVLSDSMYRQKENRLFTLLIKGVIVYLLSMGSVGFYLSALKIPYNALLCHIVIGTMAILCAMLYYRLLVENLGYLILLVGFAGLVYVFRLYINSGFYETVNKTVEIASQYFDTDVNRLYTVMIDKPYVTVTCVALFVGIVMDILLNVYISRRMQYGTAVFIVMFLNVIPLYMTEEPDLLYSAMLLVGISMAYAFKSGRHYSPQVSVKRNNHVFAEWGRRKNKEISYVYDSRVMLQGGAFICAFVLLVVTAANTFWPKNTFNNGYKVNKYKELTMAAVGTLLVDGLEGFIRHSSDVGGLDSGRLGDVSSIHLDHQTDLVVQVTPYDYEMLYLRSFIGDTYCPYENRWKNIENRPSYDGKLSPEADALADSYEAGRNATSKGVLILRNVGADVSRSYLPYYSEIPVEQDKTGNDIITYYPRLTGNETMVSAEYYGEMGPYSEADLLVPEENKEAIDALIAELEISSYDEESVVAAVKDYFQQNVPYTVKPGKTPKRKDFVNYFLLENRKGYCAHYASAATLLFRELGIPARYVEGYALDYNQITMGELVDDADYSEYYDGYSVLGKTALVEVNATDADAHAWVEIYSEEKGWHPIDVTPAGEVEEVEDFWDAFDRFVSGSDDQDEDESGDSASPAVVSDNFIRLAGIVIVCVLGAAILIVFGKVLVHKIIFVMRFRRANWNERLILRYSAYRKRIARRDKEFAKKINYREQLEYLNHKRETPDKEINEKILILEQAGFSNRMISEEEYRFVEDWMKKRGRD